MSGTLLDFEFTTDPAADAERLNSESIGALVSLLNEKADEIRYAAFQTLAIRSEKYPDVYPYFDIFAGKLLDSNSYQRNIGATLAAVNARWDKEGKFDRIIGAYLALASDEKPITARVAIQALVKAVPYKPALSSVIAGSLAAVDIGAIKETMRKLILADISEVMLAVRSLGANALADEYVMKALSGDLLDKKTKKLLEAKLNIVKF